MGGSSCGRQAEVRFGAATAERLSALLQAEDDLQRLDALAVTVVRCETADELLRQASSQQRGNPRLATLRGAVPGNGRNPRLSDTPAFRHRKAALPKGASHERALSRGARGDTPRMKEPSAGEREGTPLA